MAKKAIFLLVISVFVVNGCAVVFQKGRHSDVVKIEALEDKLQDLRAAKGLLEQRLSGEIQDQQIRLKMAKKGLVITFVAEVLYSSGKAKLRPESHPILDKVVRVLQEELPGNNIGIEGHTDSEPIKHSRWKSNWELSSQRALSVLYYLEDKGVFSSRLSAIGYGEYKPVTSNSSAEGRQFNRRVEIVILPKSAKKNIDNYTTVEEAEELK